MDSFDIDDLIHRKKKWTEQEDELLRSVVAKKGSHDWKMIASFVPGRSGKQCRERWLFSLDPTINKEPWTDDEDDKLIDLQQKYGNKWSKFVDHFAGRSASSIKNRYSLLSRRKHELIHRKKSRHARSGPKKTNKTISSPKPLVQQDELFMISNSFLDELEMYAKEFELFN